MELISLTKKNFQSTVRTATEIVRRGGVLVIPTDTVYGIAANALDQKAVQKAYLIKKRDPGKPLPIFVKNLAMAKKFAKISANNEDFLETNWPGKVTAILPKKAGVKIFGTSDKTIALRIPHFYFVNSLLENLDLPLTGTSANLAGMPSSTKIDNVIDQFRDGAVLPDAVINCGDLVESNPSKIIDLTGNKPIVIRN